MLPIRMIFFLVSILLQFQFVRPYIYKGSITLPLSLLRKWNNDSESRSRVCEEVNLTRNVTGKANKLSLINRYCPNQNSSDVEYYE
jgi:hypothetical protein